MAILVSGGPSTSSAWVGGIIKKILERHNIKPHNPEALKENLKQHHLFQEKKLSTDIASVTSVSTQTVMVQLVEGASHKSISSKTNNYYQLPIPHHILSHCFQLIETHANLGQFLQESLIPVIKTIIFVHRNPLDEMASIVRLYGINDENMTKLSKSEKIDEVIYDAKTNAKNYLISSSDSKKSLFWKLNTMQQIRQGYIDFLKAKEQGLNAHEFTFEKVTINNEIGEIERLTKILNLHASATEVFEEMSLSKKTGNHGFHKNKKKVNIAEEYFDELTLEFLEDFFGDVMALFNYIKPNQYSCFISKAKKINVICIDQPIELAKDNLFILNKLCEIDQIFSLDHIKFNQTTLDPHKKYIVFPGNHNAYYSAKTSIQLNSINNCIIYPYHKAIYEYSPPLFILNTEKITRMNKIHEEGNNFAVIHFNIALEPIIDPYVPMYKSLTVNNKNIISFDGNQLIQQPQILNSINRHIIHPNFFLNEKKRSTYLIGDFQSLRHSTQILSNFKNINIEGALLTEPTMEKKINNIDIVDFSKLSKLNYDYLIITLDKNYDYPKLNQLLQYLNQEHIDNFYILHIPNMTNEFNNSHNKNGLVDSTILCTNEPDLIYKLSRETHSSINIFSTLPLYLYKEPTLLDKLKTFKN